MKIITSLLTSFILAVIFLIPKTSFAQIELLKDINTNPSSLGSSNPDNLTVIGNTIYFSADNGSTGAEFWKSDGTGGGTTLIKDIYPGIRGSNIASITDAGGTIFFTADDGNGTELWKSDGTQGGTVMVRELNFPSISQLTYVGGVLYFTGNNRLWKSDGSEAGTIKVDGLFNTQVGNIRAFNGELYFIANNSQLWKTDGTGPGTAIIKDLNSVTGSIVAGSGANLYLLINGNTLWVSNGTEVGTTEIKTFSFFPSGFTDVNGTLFFSADNGTDGKELWKSDGTIGGTSMVKDIQVGGSSSPGFLTNVDGTLFFSAFQTSSGRELWKSDGTDGGTVLVKDINDGSGSSKPEQLININGTLFFTDGFRLWKSDGTDVGTVEISFSSFASKPDDLVDLGGTLVFSGADDVAGRELIKSDGTVPGTSVIKNIKESTADSFVSNARTVNGHLFFGSSDGINGHELWVSDGTTAGTKMVKDINQGGDSSPGASDQVAVLNNTYFFTADDGVNGWEVWKSDGTDPGTTMVKDINTSGNGAVGILGVVGSNVYLRASDGTNGFELWKSDGTSGNTTMVKDINPNAASSVNTSPTSSGSKIEDVNGIGFFSADDGTNGFELWKTDGTEPNTVLVKDINGSGSSHPSKFEEVGGVLFFSANDGANGQELWKSDGTSGGTTMVKDIRPGGNSFPQYLTNVNGTLYFTANDGSGTGLWISDGSEAGTILLKNLAHGSDPELTPIAGGEVLFTNHFGQVWKTDGTVDGTVQVIDLTPSGISSDPNEFFALNDNIFFTGKLNSNSERTELWGTNGLPENTLRATADTRLERSVVVGAIGNKLLLRATSDLTGQELYSLTPQPNWTRFSIGTTLFPLIDQTNYTIDLEVDNGSDLTNLIPRFVTVYGVSVEIEGVPQESDVTIVDFTNPVTYTLTQNVTGVSQDWVVTVTEKDNTETKFLTFTFDEISGSASINNFAYTITAAVPFGTDVTSIVPEFSLSEGAVAKVGNVTQISSTTTNDFSDPVRYAVIAEDGIISSEWTVRLVELPASTETDFQSFNFPGVTTEAAVIHTNFHDIEIEVARGTDLTSLIADFTLSTGATAKVGVIDQESGVTSNDFSSPVLYTLTAQDGSTSQTWDVFVKEADNTETEILSFTVPEQVGTTVIDNVNHTVDLEVPFGTFRSSMIATFELSEGATAKVWVNPIFSGISPRDYENPVTFTITAQDNVTIQDWVVSITELPNNAADILSFAVPTQAGSAQIDDTNFTVNIKVGKGTDFTSITAVFDLSQGAIAQVDGTPQVSGVSINNFTNPVVYKVTAQDGVTIQNWTVSLTELSDETDFISFGFGPLTSGTPSIDLVNHTIQAEVINGTDLTTLIAEFSLSDGASAKVNFIPQVNGITSNNFSTPLTYRVIAEDGQTVQDWLVTVNPALSSEAFFLDYSLPGATRVTLNFDLEAQEFSIDVVMENGVDLSNLVASFSISDGASATINGVSQESDVTSNDFTNALTYRVTAADGVSFTNWPVNITFVPSSQTDFVSFSIPNQLNASDINHDLHTISVDMQADEDITNLIATFDLSVNATAVVRGLIQESGVTPNDFSNPVTYLVNAEDGLAAQPWVVTVNLVETLGIPFRKGEINVYPSPADHYLTINVSIPHDYLELSIIELTGKVAFNSSIETGKKIDVSSLDAGIYLVTVQTESKIFSGRIIIK